MAHEEQAAANRAILKAAAQISDAVNFMKPQLDNFKKIEDKFDNLEKKFDIHSIWIRAILENNPRTGELGAIKRISNLEEWRLEIDYLLQNVKGRIAGYSAVAVFGFYLLGKAFEWALKFIKITEKG